MDAPQQPSPPGEGGPEAYPPGQRQMPSPPGQGQTPSPPGGRQTPSPPIAMLMKSLARPTFRKAFVNDPLRALERQGMQQDKFEQGQLDVLAGLSEEDLEVVVGVVAQLRGSPRGGAVSL